MGKLGPRRRRDALASLRGSLATRGYVRDGTWVPSTGNLEMSQALTVLVSPYLSEETDLLEARVLALLGGVAWNLAVVPDVGKDERIELLRRVTPEGSLVLDLVLDDLRLRKREQFPDDRRVIALTNVHLQSDGSFFFSAAAAAD